MILCNKYTNKTGKVSDQKRNQRKKRLITTRGLIAVNLHLLKNGQHTAQSIKTDLVLTVSNRKITRYCNRLGWKKIRTRYCQIVSPNNRIKRFVYGCCAKIFREKFFDSIHADECSVEIRKTTIKTWFKPSLMLRAAGGKIGKPKLD